LPSCGTPAWVKDRPPVELVDLPCFGRPARLVWHKHRWRCPDGDCEVASWTGKDPRIAPPRGAMTDRAGRWVCDQVGRVGRTVAEVARELGCDWHTMNEAVMVYGAALIDADTDRIGEVSALGLDETLFCRQGRWRSQQWCTSIVDVSPRPHPAARCRPWSQRRRPQRLARTAQSGLARRDPLRRAGPVGPVPHDLRRHPLPRHPGRRPVPPRAPRQLEAG
jgi:hypothetical protein